MQLAKEEAKNASKAPSTITPRTSTSGAAKKSVGAPAAGSTRRVVAPPTKADGAKESKLLAAQPQPKLAPTVEEKPPPPASEPESPQVRPHHGFVRPLARRGQSFSLLTDQRLRGGGSRILLFQPAL